MATVNLGKIKLKWRGTWSSGGSYTADDVVEYTDGSVTSSFIAVASSSNQAPSSGGTVNTTYWNLAAKGQASSPTTTQGDIIVRGASADGRLAIGAAGEVLKVNSGANGLEYGDVSGKVIDIKTVRHTTSTSFNVGSTNLAGANVFYFPYTSAAMLEISYARTSASNAIILQGHYSINTDTNSHAMYAFVAEDSSIRKNLAIDEHNAARQYLNTPFFCMFTAAELGSTISARTFTVSIGAGNNRTHTGVRSPNLNSSYSDTSNAPHYSEMTLMEVVAS